MTPERLAEIEQLADNDVAHHTDDCPLWYDGCHCLERGALDLIAHIRDLEAQLAAAREALGRIAFEDEVVYLGCADLPFCQRTHDESCPVRIARDALATATPPSPEVGE